jgi:hypothetical protein
MAVFGRYSNMKRAADQFRTFRRIFSKFSSQKFNCFLQKQNRFFGFYCTLSSVQPHFDVLLRNRLTNGTHDGILYLFLDMIMFGQETQEEQIDDHNERSGNPRGRIHHYGIAGYEQSGRDQREDP